MATSPKSSSKQPVYEGDPPFTLKQCRDAIPAHCFNRSVLHSFAYLAVDILLVAGCFFAASLIDVYVASPYVRWLVCWPLYWFVCGCFSTGIWVIAHECGHQAFSDYRWLNDLVGLICHSFLLVPYHSWRISHGMHHKHTADMHSDQVFVPVVASEHPTSSLLHGTLFRNICGIVIMLVGGWPAYLIYNVASQKYGERTNHFEPSSPIFQLWDKEQFNPNAKKKSWWKTTNYFILISDLGVVATFVFLLTCAFKYGPLNVCKYYGGVLLVVNAWLVCITFLQHTDVRVPHYRGEEWSFIKGALSTIDRDYGLLNIIFHRITDTHVAHHMFSTMPHYHAKEATEALKKVIGEYYHWDDQPVYKALYKCWSECQYVEDEGNMLRYLPGEAVWDTVSKKLS